MAKQFNSFEEIDAQLKIIKLRKEIGKEYIKLEINSLKNIFNPKNWVRGFETGFQGLMISLLLTKLLKRK